MSRPISIFTLPALLGAVVAASLALAAPAAADPVPLAQIGSSGAGAGQLNHPEDVAVDRSGNLYVADTDNNRISVFGPNGTFIRAFGWGVDTGAEAFEVCTTASTCQAGISGGGQGQLFVPYGLAVDGSGNLYVGDEGNFRIDVFDTGAPPTFTRAFGQGVVTGPGSELFEVCTPQTTCEAGTGGDTNGALNSPEGVALGLALDGSVNLYVADSSNHRISVFNTAGPSFKRAFGW